MSNGPYDGEALRVFGEDYAAFLEEQLRLLSCISHRGVSALGLALEAMEAREESARAAAAACMGMQASSSSQEIHSWATGLPRQRVEAPAPKRLVKAAVARCAVPGEEQDVACKAGVRSSTISEVSTSAGSASVSHADRLSALSYASSISSTSVSCGRLLGTQRGGPASSTSYCLAEVETVEEELALLAGGQLPSKPQASCAAFGCRGAGTPRGLPGHSPVRRALEPTAVPLLRSEPWDCHAQPGTTPELVEQQGASSLHEVGAEVTSASPVTPLTQLASIDGPPLARSTSTCARHSEGVQDDAPEKELHTAGDSSRTTTSAPRRRGRHWLLTGSAPQPSPPEACGSGRQ